MKERGIVMAAESVRAIQAEKKTQTRRVIRRDVMFKEGDSYPWYIRRRDAVWDSFRTMEEMVAKHCPYGLLGDRLWVRETYTYASVGWDQEQQRAYVEVDYRADDARRRVFVDEDIADAAEGWIADREVDGNGNNWRSARFMPKWASRLLLEVVGVGVQRLQEISKRDAIAEGIRWSEAFPEGYTYDGAGRGFGSAEGAFSYLWESINGKAGFGWDVNPFVWVVEFRRVG